MGFGNGKWMWKWNEENILNPKNVTWWKMEKGKKLCLNDLMPCNDYYTVNKTVLEIEDDMIFCER